MAESFRKNTFYRRMSPVFSKESRAELRALFTVSKNAPLSEKIMRYSGAVSNGAAVSGAMMALASPVHPLRSYLSRIVAVMGVSFAAWAVCKLSRCVNIMKHEGVFDTEGGFVKHGFRYEGLITRHEFEFKVRLSRLIKSWKEKAE